MTWLDRPALPPLLASRLEIREAGPDDRAALQAVLDGAPEFHERTEGAPAGPRAAAHLLDEVELDPMRRVWLLSLKRGGAPAGLLDVWLDQPEPGTAHVGLLLLREPLQAQGLGAEAAAALERALAEAGYRHLRLSVGDENPGAAAFWERVGYEAIGRLDGGVTLFEKRLGG